MSASANGNSDPRWLFVGGTGRVGQMLRCAWQHVAPRHSIIWQRRVAVPHAPEDWVWDPADGPDDLVRNCRERPPLRGMLVFAGVTPSATANYSENVDILESCIDTARHLGVSRLIVASSSAVYGASTAGPIPESAPLQPVNDYGRSKVMVEEACARHRSDGLQISCLRIGNVLGADALMVNARRASQANPLCVDIFPDGFGVRRTYIGPATLARVLDMLMAAPSLPECVNVGLRLPVLMDQLAERSGVPWLPKQIADDRLQNITLDCGLLSSLTPGLLDQSIPETMFNELSTLGLWP